MNSIGNKSVVGEPFIHQFTEYFYNLLFFGFKDQFGLSFFSISYKLLGLFGLSFFIISLLCLFYFIIKNKKLGIKSLPILWFFIVGLIFSILYKSSSHTSRYPFFIILPLSAIGFYIIDYLIIYKKKLFKIGVLFIIILILFISGDYHSLTSYSNIYQTRILSGEQIINIDSDCKIAIEGWPSTIYSSYYFNNFNNPNLFILGFDAIRGNIINITNEIIKDNNICYFIYEKVSCFNNLCPNQIFKSEIESAGYKLISSNEIIDPINNDRFIIIYKIVKK